MLPVEEDEPRGLPNSLSIILLSWVSILFCCGEDNYLLENGKYNRPRLILLPEYLLRHKPT